MTEHRDSTEPPPPFERLDWFRERCTGRCAAMTMHKRKAGTTGGECATCGAKLPSAGASNGHAVELAGASVAHAAAAAVAIMQSLPEHAEPDLLCVHCAKPRSAHFKRRLAGDSHPFDDYCDLRTGLRFTAVERLHYEPRDAADVLLNPSRLPTLDTPSIAGNGAAEFAGVVAERSAHPCLVCEKQREQMALEAEGRFAAEADAHNARADLAAVTEDRDRWAARVKLLEAERDEAVRILQGLRR